MAAAGKDSEQNRMEEIYARHVDMVYRISLSYLKNPADAEDATADVFARLLRKNPEFHDAEHEKAWLIRTAINICKDRLRHWWNRRADISERPDSTGPVDSRSDEVWQAVIELPPRYKDVIYLYYYEGYTSREVAEILKRPHSSVRSQLREARERLKGVLQNEGRQDHQCF